MAEYSNRETVEGGRLPSNVVHPLRALRRWAVQNVDGSSYSGALSLYTDVIVPPVTALASGRWIMRPENALAQLAILAQGSAGQTGIFRLFGLRGIQKYGQPEGQWTSFLMGSGTFTCGTKTGHAGGVLNANWKYIDTITLTTTIVPTASIRVMNSASDVAILECDVRDFEYLAMELSTSGGTLTALNLLESFVGL